MPGWSLSPHKGGCGATITKVMGRRDCPTEGRGPLASGQQRVGQEDVPKAGLRGLLPTVPPELAGQTCVTSVPLISSCYSCYLLIPSAQSHRGHLACWACCTCTPTYTHTACSQRHSCTQTLHPTCTRMHIDTCTHVCAHTCTHTHTHTQPPERGHREQLACKPT